MIRITDQISIDECEIEESFVRSSGPGGQNVNKLSTAVQLRFDVRRSPSLPNDVALRLMRLAGRRADQGRRAGADRAEPPHPGAQPRRGAERLVELIQEAAVKPVPRRATKPTKASKKRRRRQEAPRGIKDMRQQKPRSTDRGQCPTSESRRRTVQPPPSRDRQPASARPSGLQHGHRRTRSAME